ncbi:MAG: hypothetical protein AB7G17_14530 [Phycisphaerales bacterium]
MTPAQRRIQAANAISDAANGVSTLPLTPQPAPTGQAARAAVSTCDQCGTRLADRITVESPFYLGT